MVHRTGLDGVAKRRYPIIAPSRESNAGRPVRGLVSILTEAPRLLDRNFKSNKNNAVYLKSLTPSDGM
jgi:hypothetical protein